MSKQKEKEVFNGAVLTPEEIRENDMYRDIQDERESKKKAYLEAKAKRPNTIELEVEGFVCKLKWPDRGLYSRAISLITPVAGSPIDPIKAGSLILNTCWIEGDEEIKTDTELNISACMQVVSLIEIKEATIKKN